MGHRIDITGQRFGQLTVIKFDHKDYKRQQFWLCKCDCGKESVVMGHNLKSGGTKSCGCSFSTSPKRGGLKHGMTHTPEFKAWQNAIERCINPTHQAFFNYGMRGISVCERWLHSFENFFADMGLRPSPKHELDRYPDNDGNYEPTNCRWATRKESSGNRRSNHWIDYDGKKMILADWEIELGLRKGCLNQYIRKGRYSGQEAIGYYLKREGGNPTRKLVESDVVKIRERISQGILEQEIANEFGVTKPTINKIKLGRIWKQNKKLMKCK